ncbi:LAG1-DNAbind-domain-containing protein [Dacryopinax primogenitus]|uniref:LAG1-DNAbind-domain-containing protein n=1 Tax=Dacryopinax primogenitus (strain DJM 731) TaxID=1858805 RepID=M5GD25_DACPD|nr:LAG1-DNAbind-domain-containing protein [Dacryopinax primogenitus]EJU04187.1 LAG1-DNAbind-domain-containing protein [Dacryopinax primogenitus]
MVESHTSAGPANLWSQPMPEWGMSYDSNTSEPGTARGYPGMSLQYLQQHHLGRQETGEHQTFGQSDVDSAINALQAQHVRALDVSSSDMAMNGGYAHEMGASTMGGAMAASGVFDVYSNQSMQYAPSGYDNYGMQNQAGSSHPHASHPQRDMTNGFASLASIPSDFLSSQPQLGHSQSFPSLPDISRTSGITAFTQAPQPTPVPQLDRNSRYPGLSIDMPPNPIEQHFQSDSFSNDYPPSSFQNSLLHRHRGRSSTVSSAASSSSAAIESPLYDWDGSDNGATSDYSLNDLGAIGAMQDSPFNNFNLNLGGYQAPSFHRSHSLPQLHGVQAPALPHFLRNQPSGLNEGTLNPMILPSTLPTPPTSKGPSPVIATTGHAHSVSIDLATPRYETELRFPVMPPQRSMSADGSQLESLDLDPITLQRSMEGLSRGDIQAVLQPYIEKYVNSKNRFAVGERSVMVMSPKVGQKSYGTEKRFLCPPPSVMMIGTSWFHPAAGSSSSRGSPHSGGSPVAAGWATPKVNVLMSTQDIDVDVPPDHAIEWCLPSGEAFQPDNPPSLSAGPFFGRFMGKSLYISDVDEKKKKVEAVVKVFEAGSDMLVGNFVSKPIRVISKPSKKRASVKANFDLVVNHGSTVALFHRLRAQTVSTKYLCVAGAGANIRGSDGRPLLGAKPEDQQPAFVARTSTWDTFIIYIVDVNFKEGENTQTHRNASLPDYPAPPPAALVGLNSQTPIYYNQTVVLQCLLSGVVSPILIIRRVDHNAVIVGGSQMVDQDCKLRPSQTAPHDQFCAPGEVCGDPVSQLHKIAFEVYDANKRVPTFEELGTPGSYLSCAVDKVNTFTPSERRWNKSSRQSSTEAPGVPMLTTRNSSVSPSQGEDSSSGPSSPAPIFRRPGTPAPTEMPGDGGKVKRKRGSISAGLVGKVAETAAARGKRRNSAASVLHANGEAQQPGARRATEPGEAEMSNGSTWNCDVSDACVWTLVGTEFVRYNFYVPPILYNLPHTSSIPRFPFKPITPMPTIVKYLPPDRASELPRQHLQHFQQPEVNHNGVVAQTAVGTTKPPDPDMLTLYGQNFDKSEPLLVYFGSEPSAHVDMRCSEVLQCLPPAKLEHDDHNSNRRGMLLVRRADGIIFPSSVLYP